MSSTDAERLARVTLSLIAEPGDARVLGLVRRFGAREFLDLLAHHPDLRPELGAAAGRLAVVEPEPVLEAATRRGIRFVVPGDDEWPVRLDDLADTGVLQDRGEVPVGLWVRGPLRLDRLADAVAIVGSRSATTYGEHVAAGIAADLARAGRPVVSGGAFGIDHAAHRGALSTDGPTLAVLACGVDRAYPAAHRALLEHLAEHHALVSEAPPGASPFRIRFLARNRVIAALTAGTVVVEAALRSGALNTANWAERLHRPVMGTPGALTSAASEGVHQLIRRGAATLVTGGDDVLEMVSEAGRHVVHEPRAPLDARDALSVRARQVLDALPVAAPAPVESVARVAGLAPTEVATLLDGLAGADLAERTPAGWRLHPSGPG